jgi:hypothetical protein
MARKVHGEEEVKCQRCKQPVFLNKGYVRLDGKYWHADCWLAKMKQTKGIK